MVEWILSDLSVHPLALSLSVKVWSLRMTRSRNSQARISIVQIPGHHRRSETLWQRFDGKYHSVVAPSLTSRKDSLTFNYLSTISTALLTSRRTIPKRHHATDLSSTISKQSRPSVCYVHTMAPEHSPRGVKRCGVEACDFNENIYTIAIEGPRKRRRQGTTLPDSFPFLSLGTDIRLMIYEELLRPEKTSISSRETSQRQGGPPTYRANTSSEGRGDPVETAILRTCKQIYNEAKDVLHRPRHLNLVPLQICSNGPIPDYGGLQRRISRHITIDPAALGAMHKLESLNLRLNMHGGEAEEELVHSRGLARQLPPDLVVQRITFVINVEKLQPYLRRKSIKMDSKKLSDALEAQIAVLRMWRDALANAHRAQYAEIRYERSGGKAGVVCKRERGEKWIVEHIQEECKRE